MKRVFLIGPFFIYLGIAAQNFGLILSAMIAPLILFAWHDFEQKNRFRILGVMLLSSWALWPICNVLAAIFLQRNTLFHPHFNLPGPLSISQHAQIKGLWFSSQLPSSVGVSGLLLLIASFYKSSKFLIEKNLDQSEYSKSNSIEIIETWIKLLFFSCLIFGVYFAIQHVTGFDFRKSQSYLPNMQFPGGTYRIQGFSGHPLTIAGISLCLVGFSSWMAGYFLGRSREMLGYSAGILLLNLFFLYASGGRTAFLIAVVWLAFMGTFIAKKLVSPKTLIISLSAAFLLLILILTVSGIGERYLEALQMNESGKLPNRVVFWRVHWQMFLDSPWVGQGYGNLSKGLRLLYYDAMGYRDFEERFNAHNMILETLSNLGILGTSALIAIMAKVYVIGKKIAKASLLTKNLGIGLIIASALNFLHGFTQNVFYDSGVMVVYMNLFWLFLWSAIPLRSRSDRL